MMLNTIVSANHVYICGKLQPLRDDTQIDFHTAKVKLTLFSDPLTPSAKRHVVNIDMSFFSLSILPGKLLSLSQKVTYTAVTWSGPIILR